MYFRLVSLTALLSIEWATVCSAAKVPSRREQVPLLVAEQSKPTKRVAIVGGGTGGVTALKTLLGDLPSETTRDWEIVLFEQHRDVGGVWLPDLEPPNYPELPGTPLYPRLKTNTPHPTMTIPNFPFRPLTDLYPHHPYVQQYHADIISHWNLSSYLRLNHEVLESRWLGTSEDGHWRLDVLDHVQGRTIQANFDHLIVANGHNHYPYEPTFEGREKWLEQSSDRIVFHSIFYREPEDYAGKNVLVVGGGASGRDIALQVVGIANSTTVSLKSTERTNNPAFPSIPGAAFKPRISHFTSDSVVFSDSSELAHIDTVILATGYDYRIPFLTAGGHLDEISTSVTLDSTHPAAIAASKSEHLVTNHRYIRPLFSHVLSLDTAYPLGALYFIGLPVFVANAISDTAGALFTAHTIANASLLSSREEFLEDLSRQEREVSRVGDPWYIGHRQVNTQGPSEESNQDRLVRYLQVRGVDQDDDTGGSHRHGSGIIPPKGKNFTEDWRILGRGQGDLLKKGWERVKASGRDTVRQWLAGRETEGEWADLLRKLIRWEKEQEKESVAKSL